MLKIKQTFHLHLPHLSFNPPQPMELSPVAEDDDDELTRAMQADPDEHDNNWQLGERPDGAELGEFWNRVEADVHKDPKWFTFED